MNIIKDFKDNQKEIKVKKLLLSGDSLKLKKFLFKNDVELYIFNRIFNSLNDNQKHDIVSNANLMSVLDNDIINSLLKSINSNDLKLEIINNKNMYDNINAKVLNKYIFSNNPISDSEQIFYNIFINSNMQKKIDLVLTKENGLPIYYVFKNLVDSSIVFELLQSEGIIKKINSEDMYSCLSLLKDTEIENLLSNKVIFDKLTNLSKVRFDEFDMIKLYRSSSSRIKELHKNNDELLNKCNSDDLISIMNLGEEYIVDGEKFNRFKTDIGFFKDYKILKKYLDNKDDLNILLSNIDDFSELKTILNTLLNTLKTEDEKNNLLEKLNPREYSSSISNYEELEKAMLDNKKIYYGNVISFFSIEDKVKCIKNKNICALLNSQDIEIILKSECGESLIKMVNNLDSKEIDKIFIFGISSYLSSEDAYNFIINNKILDKIKKDNEVTISNLKEIIDRLYNNNIYLFKTLDPKILNDNMLNMNFSFIEKLTKYPEFAQEITKLYKLNKHNAKFFEGIFNTLDKNNNNFDIQIEIILNSLNKSIIKNIDVDSLTEEDYIVLTNYLLKNDSIYNYTCGTKRNSNLNDLTIKIEINNISDLKNYKYLLNNKCDRLMDEENDINKVKNIYFNKYFNINIDEAKEIIRLYGNSINKFDLIKYKKCIEYINNINDIICINDIIKLKNKYINSEFNYTLDDTLYIDQELRKMYTNSISSSLIKKESIKCNSKITFNEKTIDVYEPDDDFKLLVNSTSAYGKMKILNDNYFDSWNQSDRTKNHGICCSYISNSNLGIANVYDILLGFDDFSDSSLQLQASHDIYSRNDKHSLSSFRSLKFFKDNDLIDNSRFVHNELVLERKELRKNSCNNYFNIQPSYIVIMDYFTDTVKENSIKASNDLNIPIIYLDTEKIAKRERNKISELINCFDNNNDLSILENIIVLHENNCNGYSNHEKIKNKYFDSTIIDNTISNYINRICSNSKRSIIDKAECIKKLQLLLKILQSEKEKFNVCNDYRKRKISINADSFIKNINEILHNYLTEIKKEFEKSNQETNIYKRNQVYK